MTAPLANAAAPLALVWLRPIEKDLGLAAARLDQAQGAPPALLLQAQERSMEALPMVMLSHGAHREHRPHLWWAILVLAIMAAALVFTATRPAAAATAVTVRIDLSSQRMQVSIGGRPTYNWAVSTARRGYRTPIGRFHPIRLERVWYSSIYDSAPMPYSVFFYGGYAVHGTNQIHSLGRAVSHGCVRLHPANASVLFNLVRINGYGNVVILITP